MRLVDVDVCFYGVEPKETLRKLVSYLVEGNFIYSPHDYRELQPPHNKRSGQVRIFNYIFAHNGWGFDYRFMLEELFSQMREMKIVGDIG